MCESFETLIETTVWQTLWPEWQPDIQTLMAACATAGLLKAAAFTIVLTDDAHIQKLNQQFRGKDKPTNVLSFPDGTIDPETGRTYLGDLVLAVETIRQEAATQQKLFAVHAQHMLVHGLLHLLGYTHDEDDDATEMEHLERMLLAAVGIPDPYAC
jgi:probable rRNA maturation factor